MTREEILSGALNELEMFFPEVKRAKLMKSGVLKEARATFSVVPGLDQFRPAQSDGVAGVVPCGRLDGDGVAVHDGGCGAEWEAGGRGGGGRCEAVYGARDSGEWLDAVVECAECLS